MRVVCVRDPDGDVQDELRYNCEVQFLFTERIRIQSYLLTAPSVLTHPQHHNLAS